MRKILVLLIALYVLPIQRPRAAEAPVRLEAGVRGLITRAPGKIAVNLPNNHLQYIITWYGLAAALAGVFVVWSFGAWRRENGGPGTPSPSL